MAGIEPSHSSAPRSPAYTLAMAGMARRLSCPKKTRKAITFRVTLGFPDRSSSLEDPLYRFDRGGIMIKR